MALRFAFPQGGWRFCGSEYGALLNRFWRVDCLRDVNQTVH
jgi:hypothetical protein